MEKEELYRYVDHTALKAFTTWKDIEKLCEEAIKYHTASVCIPSCYISRVKETYGDKIKICTVVGFPLGYANTEGKLAETKKALEAGADFIKTSTGFGTAGATMEDVLLMKEHIGAEVKIKAAGGIRTKEDMENYIKAGCSRLGTSSAVDILG